MLIIERAWLLDSQAGDQFVCLRVVDLDVKNLDSFSGPFFLVLAELGTEEPNLRDVKSERLFLALEPENGRFIGNAGLDFLELFDGVELAVFDIFGFKEALAASIFIRVNHTLFLLMVFS